MSQGLPHRGVSQFLRRRRGVDVLGCVWLALVLAGQSAHGGTFITNLFSFNSLKNGYGPRASLVEYSNCFYGVAGGGGPYDRGTIFKWDNTGVFSLLVVLDGTNGDMPLGLTLGRDGNFYGVTDDGGTNVMGSVFRMTPGGEMVTLASFSGTNGQSPAATVIQGIDGQFYGTTQFGGDFGNGTVFKMLSDGTIVTLLSFNQTNGADPMCQLLQTSDGSFYGTTRLGGDYHLGTLFRLGADGQFTSLFSFAGTNGSWPVGGLIQASDGNFYGTTFGTLAQVGGTVFRLTTNGLLTTLVTFYGTNGGGSLSGLVQGSDGNLYGTTPYGGPSSAYGPGTIFRVGLDGSFQTVYAFSGTNDGVHPGGPLLQAQDGHWYGVTSEGGAFYSGNIFRLSLPMRPTLNLFVPSQGAVHLSWTAVAGQTYLIEQTLGLNPPFWNALSPPLTATNGLMSFEDSSDIHPQRFYRATLIP